MPVLTFVPEITARRKASCVLPTAITVTVVTVVRRIRRVPMMNIATRQRKRAVRYVRITVREIWFVRLRDRTRHLARARAMRTVPKNKNAILKRNNA